MNFKSTFCYLEKHIQLGNASLDAGFFYIYILFHKDLLGKLSIDNFCEKLNISQFILYRVFKELQNIQLLKITYRSGKCSEYYPIVLSKTELNTLSKKFQLTKKLNEKKNQAIVSYDSKITRNLLPLINQYLPKKYKWHGIIPQRHCATLKDLSEKTDIKKYTAWFVKEKINFQNKSFTWGLFLYPAIIEEYLETQKNKSYLKTTSKWNNINPGIHYNESL